MYMQMYMSNKSICICIHMRKRSLQIPCAPECHHIHLYAGPTNSHVMILYNFLLPKMKQTDTFSEALAVNCTNVDAWGHDEAPRHCYIITTEPARKLQCSSVLVVAHFFIGIIVYCPKKELRLSLWAVHCSSCTCFVSVLASSFEPLFEVARTCSFLCSTSELENPTKP